MGILAVFIILHLILSSNTQNKNDFPEEIDILYDLYDFLDENYDEMMEREDVLFEKEDVEEDEWFLFTKKFLDDNEIYDEELFDWFMEHDLYSDSEVYFYLEDRLEI